MPKVFELTPLDSQGICLFSSLLSNGQLQEIGDSGYVDTELKNKFFSDYRLPAELKDNCVLVKISTEQKNTFLVRPIISEDFLAILKKASFLTNLLRDLEEGK